MPDTDIAASLAADLARMQSDAAAWGEPHVVAYDWPHWCGDSAGFGGNPAGMCNACWDRNCREFWGDIDCDDLDDDSGRTPDELDEQRDAGIYNAIGAYRDEGASDPRL